jgi:ABC-type lipoprotein release transport system permease subunit
MNDNVLVAFIGLVGSGLGSLIGVIASSKLTQYRIEQLEQKVEAHNNLVVRMYEVEKHEAILDEEIEQLKGYHK